MLTPDQRSTLAPPSPYVQASDPDTPQEWASWDQRMFAMYRYFQRVKNLIDEHKEGLMDNEEDTRRFRMAKIASTQSYVK